MLDQITDMFPAFAHITAVSMFFFAMIGCNALLYLLSHSKEFLVVCGVASIYAMVPFIHHM